MERMEVKQRAGEKEDNIMCRSFQVELNEKGGKISRFLVNTHTYTRTREQQCTCRLCEIA